VLAAGLAAPAAAQPLGPLEPVAPAGGPPAFDAPLGSSPLATPHATQRPAPSAAPPAILGAPVGVAAVPAAPAAVVDAPAAPKPRRAASLGLPRAAGATFADAPAPAAPVPADVVESGLRRAAASAPVGDPVNDFLTNRSALRDRDRDESRRDGRSGRTPKRSVSRQVGDWGERINDTLGGRNGGLFRSDHLFDGFISPVTNPFLFEDPRSLTELRPIFIYQNVPGREADFRGGHVAYFGAQGRLALTDRWSIVFSKFGGVWTNTNNPNPAYSDHAGFAELWLGPKWTFYRGEENCSLAAAGLQFQIPVGSANVYQDTGTLSIVPYVSYAKSFLRDFRAGAFNFMASTGYAFSVNNQRSDYYYLSAHLDMDVGNFHRFYPLVELNWFLVTTDGHERLVGAEGRDLFNIGGQAAGTGLLTAAFGGRVKITESAQLGAAFEVPLAGRRDFFQNRFTIDFILRY
jgi:hypothetical protein